MGSIIFLSMMTIKVSALEINETYLTEAEELSLRNTLNEDWISKEVQDVLIKKKINGELWDVEKSENLNKIQKDFFEFSFDKIEEKYIHLNMLHI